jgi:hypothetical protein
LAAAASRYHAAIPVDASNRNFPRSSAAPSSLRTQETDRMFGPMKDRR